MSEPYASTLFIPCANGGAGEEVSLTGTVKIVRQETYNNQRFTSTLHVHTEGITGVGLSTGDTFTAIGGSQAAHTGTIEYGGQYSATYTQQMRLAGQGSDSLLNINSMLPLLPMAKFLPGSTTRK